MHQTDFDFDRHNFSIQLEEISKIEGAASLDVLVRNGKVEDLKFSISEWKRFYTQAIQHKALVAIPQLVSRICGTCSNAHLLASLKAVEDICEIQPSKTTQLLRKLLYYGLIIRDHALHLYVFALPDLFHKESILDFDEHDPIQHQLLEDTFTVKEVGNKLSIIIGGRSVHAPFVGIGGFVKSPHLIELQKCIPELKAIRPLILRLIKLFVQSTDSLIMKKKVIYAARCPTDFSFIDGPIKTTSELTINENEFRSYLESKIIPYSHARGFTFGDNLLMVGALARLNLGKQYLHAKTIEDTKQYLDLFPSDNLFLNNLAQGVEILHAIDMAIDTIQSLQEIIPQPIVTPTPHKNVGVGVIEAPRGTLYYRLEVNLDGTVKEGEIIVPTGQNQILIEAALRQLIEKLVREEKNKEEIIAQSENLIRAFDPCMSCASHFLKVKWL